MADSFIQSPVHAQVTAQPAMSQLLNTLIERQGSDLHLIVGTPPTFRIDGRLAPVPGTPTLTDEEAKKLIGAVLTREQAEYIEENKELDLGYTFENKALGHG